MAVLKECGIDAVILFPLSGPATQMVWIQAAKDADIPVIIGGYMTHERYVSSEGGYIEDSAVDKIYSNSAAQGVSDYVVPGNKPEVIQKIRGMLISQKIDPIFYAPGFISQGGSISKAASVAGARWHAIVGRALYEATDMRKAALSLIRYL